MRFCMIGKAHIADERQEGALLKQGDLLRPKQT